MIGLSLGYQTIDKDTLMTQYIYARTSTNEQNVKQQADVLLAAYPDSTVRVEQASGTTMNRPVLETLLQELTGGDTLIIYDMSRLNRNTVDFLKLLERFQRDNIHLVIHNMGGAAVDTRSPVGKMVLTVLMSAEQMNIELMKEKQAIGIATAKVAGKYKGRRQSEYTVRACKKAIRLIDSGLCKQDAARASQIGIATLYRYINQHGLSEVNTQV